MPKKVEEVEEYENNEENDDNEEIEDDDDNVENDEPEEIIEEPKKKRVYKLTEEQIEQRKINLAKGREKMKARRLIKDEYKQSKKDVQNKELEIMVEKTKINKQKIDVDSTYENKKLEKKIRDLEKKILSFQTQVKHEIVENDIKKIMTSKRKIIKMKKKTF